MTKSARLRRLLLLGSVLLILIYLYLLNGAAPSQDRVQVVLPGWTAYIALGSLFLFVLSQLAAVVIRRGWRRVMPLIVLVPAVPAFLLALGLLDVTMRRVELDRTTLPDGRVVMLTLEAVPTDAVFNLWEQPEGWRWRSLFESGEALTYSEDGSFTADPRLVVSRDGRYLLVRRGGIWTDCWAIDAKGSCFFLVEGTSPGREEWLSRSQSIAFITGADPSEP